MASILIIYQSLTGNTRAMAEAVEAGVASEGVDVVRKTIAEAGIDDLPNFDGVIIGSPTYFGATTAEVKRFIDDSIKYYKKLGGKVGAAFTSCGDLGGGGETAILLKPDLSTRRAETTLGHEIRELIENAFKRVSPRYVGLDTSDNPAMNLESEQFAALLLMQGQAMHQRLDQIGFDLVRFAGERRRSLSSVIRAASSRTRAGTIGGWGSTTVSSTDTRITALISSDSRKVMSSTVSFRMPTGASGLSHQPAPTSPTSTAPSVRRRTSPTIGRRTHRDSCAASRSRLPKSAL